MMTCYMGLDIFGLSRKAFPRSCHYFMTIYEKVKMRKYTIQITPGTNYELVFIPPSGEIQKMEAVADGNGKCIWKWKLEELQEKGYGRLILTIDGKSETHFIEIRPNF